jgi:hypothetical protein
MLITTEFTSSIHIKKSPSLDVDSTLGSLHHVDVVNNAYFLGVHTDSIFRVKVGRVDQCSLSKRPTTRKDGGWSLVCTNMEEA